MQYDSNSTTCWNRQTSGWRKRVAAGGGSAGGGRPGRARGTFRLRGTQCLRTPVITHLSKRVDQCKPQTWVITRQCRVVSCNERIVLVGGGGC